MCPNLQAHNHINLNLFTQHKSRGKKYKFRIGLHTEMEHWKKLIWDQSLGYTEQIAEGNTQARNSFCRRIKSEAKAKSAISPPGWYRDTTLDSNAIGKERAR